MPHLDSGHCGSFCVSFIANLKDDTFSITPLTPFLSYDFFHQSPASVHQNSRHVSATVESLNSVLQMSTLVEAPTSTNGEAAPVMRPPINMKWDEVSAQVSGIIERPNAQGNLSRNLQALFAILVA
jgi:hypothetical protein